MLHEQQLKLTHSFTWVDLCVGLGTPCIAYEAVRRALQPYGLCPASKCIGLPEMSKGRRDALSRCNSTPKSLTYASGSSGKSWLDFLKCVDLLTFEERPTTITLKCVENLSNNRTVQGHKEKKALSLSLRPYGSVAMWDNGERFQQHACSCHRAVLEFGRCSSR